MKLFIVESPAKAKTISKYIGDGYEVRASVGHIRDLPKSNKNAIDIKGGFIPNYEISPGKEKVVSELQRIAKKADEIIVATDPDREGEAIAWHITELIDPKQKKTKRVVYHEITKEAILEALEHPRAIDMHLKEAQEARRVLDRLVGYDLSGLIWKKVRYGLSAGRVQSPALRIIMEREREIRAFKPETFWIIRANTKTKNKEPLLLTCSLESRDKKEVDSIVEHGEKEPWVVKEVKETKINRSPRPPFITSTLQQAASSRFGFAPSRTMRIAQKLYEAGYITYMRTDSTTLSAQAIGQIEKVISETYGPELIQKRAFKTKSKNAQEAHEAIRPSKASVKSAGINDEQKKLYSLIWQRTIASQMADAEVLRTRITGQTEKETVPPFVANGSRVLSPGWLLADPQARAEDVELPKVNKGESLELVKIETEEKQTEPPNRYSEAGLVKELEKRGIGRPSTYASIIQTLGDREYINKEAKALVPTDTGDVVSSFLEENFAHYISDSFTAEMENELDEIANGEREYSKTLADFYKPFSKEVSSKKDIAKLTDLGNADSKHICPICSSPMIIKLGRGGKFLSCIKYPECTGARTIDGEEIGKEEPIGEHPETKEPIYVLSGRFGPYVQVGEKTKSNPKPKRASIPKGMPIDTIKIEDAMKFLSLPRTLGSHPESGKDITANVGRFGPYIAHNIDPKPDFRSLKTDDVYNIDLARALEILAEEKKVRRGFKKKS